MLKVFNTNEDCIVAFKVRSLNAERYIVRPPVGVLHPKEELEIQIILQYDKLPEREGGEGGEGGWEKEKDLFQIQSLPLKDTNFASHKEIFLKTPQQAISSQFVKCKFVSDKNSVLNSSKLHFTPSPSPSPSSFSSPSPSSPLASAIRKPLSLVEEREKGLEKQVQVLMNKVKELEKNQFQNQSESSQNNKTKQQLFVPPFILHQDPQMNWLLSTILFFFLGFLFCWFLKKI